jgi:GTP-binding protein
VDLPGYGYAKVPHKVRKQWSPLIEDYCRNRKNLCGAVVIIDARTGPTPLDLSLIEWLRTLSKSSIITMTKADKLSKNKMAQALRQTAEALAINPEQIVTFSAHTGEGKKQMWQKISYLIDPSNP